MQETNEMRDRLINEFAENYMEKLFYFCLKKTGSHIEAEDLTQDVALQIITALNKGTIPTSCSAWVWQIARNRYSVWAKEKHNRNESVTGSDIGDYEIEDESENILDEMIHTEQMALLRRELAFIKSDYRNIIVVGPVRRKWIIAKKEKKRKKIIDGTEELDVFDEGSDLFVLKNWTFKATPMNRAFFVSTDR